MIDYPEGEPCWAPGAADYLASILTGDEVALEWGGGASSVWLADRVKVLNTVENDLKWAQWVREKAARSKVNILYIKNIQSEFYVDPFAEPEFGLGHINLWLIDGFRRIDCLELVERKVRSGDIVVADDALDYAEHLLSYQSLDIHRFAMPHPHAGIPCQSRRNKLDRNTVRTHAPETKETWIWRA